MFAQDLLDINTKYVPADLEFLTDVYINGMKEQVLPMHLPGF